MQAAANPYVLKAMSRTGGEGSVSPSKTASEFDAQGLRENRPSPVLSGRARYQRNHLTYMIYSILLTLTQMRKLNLREVKFVA